MSCTPHRCRAPASRRVRVGRVSLRSPAQPVDQGRESVVQPAAQNQRNPENATPPRRLLTLLFVGNLAMYPTLFGVPGLLLPSQLATIDAAGKVANFAVIAAVAATVGAIAQPVAGAFSDRARPRFGRRPFLISGAAVAAVLLWLLGLAVDDPRGLLCGRRPCWPNVYQAAIVAVVPDQIARERRGRFFDDRGDRAIGLVLGLTVGAAAHRRWRTDTRRTAAGGAVVILIGCPLYSPLASAGGRRWRVCGTATSGGVGRPIGLFWLSFVDNFCSSSFGTTRACRPAGRGVGVLTSASYPRLGCSPPQRLRILRTVSAGGSCSAR